MRMVWILMTGIGAWIAAPVFGGEGRWIVKDHRPLACIVVSDMAPRTTRLAARELQVHVQLMTGAMLPIETTRRSDMPLVIYVGQSQYTDALQVSSDDLRHGAYRITSGPDWMVLIGRDTESTPREPYARNRADMPRMYSEWDSITGEKWGNPVGGQMHRRYQPTLGIRTADEFGSLQAVYALLRHWGIRWYMPGDLGRIVPEVRSLSMPNLNRRVEPDFPLRWIYFAFYGQAPLEDLMWRLRLGLNDGDHVLGPAQVGHGTRTVHARDEVKEAHPDWFALYDGVRDTEKKGAGRPCLSSPGLIDGNVRYCRAVFDTYDVPVVSVMPQDGFSAVCQCELCDGKATVDRGLSGSMSDYVWDYVNRVAVEVYKTHPDRMISCFAYGTYLLPPERIRRLSPNVLVGVVQSRGQWRDPSYRKALLSVREGWLSRVANGNIVIWDHYLHGVKGGPFDHIPVFFPHSIAEDLRSLKGRSHGDFIEVPFGGPDSTLRAPGVNHLNIYVTARLYWDVNQDVDVLLDEYCRDFYGPAAGPMRQLINHCEARWPEMRSSVEQLDRMFALLTEARSVAGQSVYGKRIEMLADYVAPLQELRERLSKGRENVPRALGRDLPSAREVQIDGQLDDALWREVGSYPLSELQSGDPVDPQRRTHFQAGWDGDALLLAVHCLEPDMAGLTFTTQRHEDGAIFNGDNVEILIETQSHSYYQIAVNPAGAMIDLDRGIGVNAQWSSHARVAAFRGDGYWSVEMRIPVAGDQARQVDALSGVAGRRPTDNFPWYINVGRHRVRGEVRQLEAFAPTGRTTFHVPDRFGFFRVR